MNIAVLASGNGTNFEAIAKAAKRGYIRADIKLLISDRKDAYVRVRAKKIGVRDIFVDPQRYASRMDFDKALVRILKKEKIDLVVLAGFMRVLSSYFVKKFKNRVLNIHPALLPAFRGERAIKRAFDYGCKVTGVTVHFIDADIDHGPIILQEPLLVKQGMGLLELEKLVHRMEHRLYPLAIKLLIEGKLKIKGRRVSIV